MSHLKDKTTEELLERHSELRQMHYNDHGLDRAHRSEIAAIGAILRGRGIMAPGAVHMVLVGREDAQVYERTLAPSIAAQDAVWERWRAEYDIDHRYRVEEIPA